MKYNFQSIGLKSMLIVSIQKFKIIRGVVVYTRLVAGQRKREQTPALKF